MFSIVLETELLMLSVRWCGKQAGCAALSRDAYLSCKTSHTTRALCGTSKVTAESYASINRAQCKPSLTCVMKGKRYALQAPLITLMHYKSPTLSDGLSSHKV